MIRSRHKTWVRITLAAVAFSLALQSSAVAETPARDEGIEERTRARLVTARVRIQPTWGAEPGACLDLDAQDLKVSLRGRRVDADSVELDRRRGRTLHALLVDTSSSMASSMDYVRRAAREYVDRLDPEYDRALIVTFDDSVLLHQGVTGERELLAEAVERLRPGMSTALHDGLHYVAQEISAHRERPVIVLLSDGQDTSSLHRREDVMDLLDRRPDLTVFAIGFNLPMMSSGAPPGRNSIRRFLHRLAYSTNGKFFQVHTAGRLDDAYLRIDEMLNSEAIVRVVDPDPTDEPGKLKISARKAGCKVQIFRTRKKSEDPLTLPLGRPWADPPMTIELPPDPRYLRELTNRAYYSDAPECAGTDETEPNRPGAIEGLWRADVQDGAIRGCVFDVIMDVGPLFDLNSMGIPNPWWEWNAFLKTKTRPFEVLAPGLHELPEDPVEVARRLADRAVDAAGAEIERDSRKKPYDEHARPYHDLPVLVHGRTFFDLRERLAVALFSMKDYRQWALAKLAEEAETDLLDLRDLFRRRAPTATDEAIDEAIELSEEGRRIIERAKNPAPLDLARHLSAWLGDLAALDLFERWESERIEASLHREPTDQDRERFVGRWGALRDLLFASSYTRELTLLMPAHDPRDDRIGYYRVILPRPAWYQTRIRNYKNHPGWSDLPFDLVPDRPLAYSAFAWLASEHPDVADHLQRRDYRVTAVDYRSFAKPRKQSPLKALRQVRVAVELASDPGRLRIEFDLERDADQASETTLVDMRLAVDGDPVFEALASAARERATPRVLADSGR